MKKFSKIIYTFIFVLASLFLVQGLNLALKNHETASATQVNRLFNYVSITQEGQKLSSKNLNITSGGEVAYLTVNDSITLNFEPLKYNYQFSVSGDSSSIEDCFGIDWSKEIPVPAGARPSSFSYGGKTYFYDFSGANLLIYDRTASSPNEIVSPSVYSQHNSLLKYDSANKTLKIAKSFRLSTPKNLDLTIKINTINNVTNSISVENYNLRLLKPVLNFKTDDFISYDLVNYVHGHEEVYSDVPAIKDEFTYHKLRFNITSNKYTEINPLYININYNGFIYNFTMYSVLVANESYLVVNYNDSSASNSQNLATVVSRSSTGVYTIDNNYPVYPAYIGGELNGFDFEFTNTGRYEIEIYDNTHVYNLKSQNYYTSSFYILDQTADDYSNIYAIAQSLRQVGNDPVKYEPIEYINIKVEQDFENDVLSINNSVRVTFKNLNLDAIDEITVYTTVFGNSDNLPSITSYTAQFIKNCFMNNDSEYIINGEFTLPFENDAYYKIDIIPKSKSIKSISSYSFQIIKQAKSSFTYFIDGEAKNYKANTAFHTDRQNYSTRIYSALNINYIAKIKDTSSEISQSARLIKTYVNRYSVSYGMEQVDIKVEARTSNSISIGFYGVGDLKVTVTINGETYTETLNSETGNNILTYEEFGTYTCTIEDSMGTYGTAKFTLTKSLNTSAIVLISLSSVIAVFVIVFILRARGRVRAK